MNLLYLHMQVQVELLANAFHLFSYQELHLPSPAREKNIKSCPVFLIYLKVDSIR